MEDGSEKNVVQMPEEMDIIEYLGELLAMGDTATVKTMLTEERFLSFLTERANDIIPVAAFYLTNEVIEKKPAVFRCVRKLIMKCAENGNPKECLMEYLAQIESLDEVKFENLLKPVQTAMLRIPDRKGPLLQCVFNVIYSFINSLPWPKDYQFDNESKIFLECDEQVQHITSCYCLIVKFYEPFVNDVSDKLIYDNRTKAVRLVLLQALFQLLGSPLVALDLEHGKKAESEIRMLASKTVKFILKLQSDPLQFLTLVEENYLLSVEEERRVVKELTSNEIKFSDLSLAVFFYLIFNENMCSSFPLVYNNIFIFQNCLTLAVTLLKYKETLVLRKGLLLTKHIIEMNAPGVLPFVCLVSDAHKDLLQLLSNVIVFHDVKENRTLASELIKKHFYMFEPKGQFYILVNSRNVAPLPNLMGFFTTMLTNVMREAFNRDDVKEYFTGKRLFDLMNIYCSLKNGVETDLIENKDQILSALNLIIFLTKQDRTNHTKVWDYIPDLTKKFLSPLREGLDLSRAHYKLELRSLDDPLKTEDGADLSVSIGGQKLGNLSKEEKKSVIESGLTIFDLIGHVLRRVNECVEDIPSI